MSERVGQREQRKEEICGIRPGGRVELAGRKCMDSEVSLGKEEEARVNKT